MGVWGGGGAGDGVCGLRERKKKKKQRRRNNKKKKAAAQLTEMMVGGDGNGEVCEGGDGDGDGACEGGDGDGDGEVCEGGDGDGDGEVCEAGDGDGDGEVCEAGDGDGDGEVCEGGDGDGDGEVCEAGDGDGDGEVCEAGDGDGDGDVCEKGDDETEEGQRLLLEVVNREVADKMVGEHSESVVQHSVVNVTDEDGLKEDVEIVIEEDKQYMRYAGQPLPLNDLLPHPQISPMLELDKYWSQRYRLFSRYDDGVCIDRGMMSSLYDSMMS